MLKIPSLHFFFDGLLHLFSTACLDLNKEAFLLHLQSLKADFTRYTWPLSTTLVLGLLLCLSFQEYLPLIPVQVLDIGGPGHYSIALAQSRHQVTLLDLSRNCLELAGQKAQETGVKIADFKQGNALGLSRAEHIL